MEKNKLIIFAKQPERGKVKTRLAVSIGEDQTLKIYLELLEITKKITSTLSVEKIVYWDHLHLVNTLEFEFGDSKKVQAEGDLGLKMKIAFENEFRSNFGKVLIIGTDCPFLTKEILEKAYHSLDDTDFVIGPAMDGGYYLLGMREFFPFVFDSIPWSTSEVFPLTLEVIQKNKKTVTLLTELNDIDDIFDLNDWKGPL
ncbi:TIGR04282 family arsenosugar biosynthesis glycosyltransferase [Leptospira meyeri]|uniref:TIGR04282 family arsenosugar biosynthesis glycosyltransferase n=1 Tax=Leptospira meyeri TaxID=29508 RepID=UPI000C2A11BE|nr:TIGR04282 family arsenosugar biosynthesis glycosyltransferase [Leptospira meyeri]MCW7487514.1 TIGR04282 family arsenosugar biosynthesis glycosyltransferase [Leptospira meyeri]PJZ79672.1 transferase [Leptospira meyeri]PJZ95924.1 transferase [Leptospira meyeri]TGM63443.1 glycosyltransferase [Leptospira meyeri]TGM70541.1 glycosyltransferase [Leptospira meyeri]